MTLLYCGLEFVFVQRVLFYFLAYDIYIIYNILSERIRTNLTTEKDYLRSRSESYGTLTASAIFDVLRDGIVVRTHDGPITPIYHYFYPPY